MGGTIASIHSQAESDLLATIVPTNSRIWLGAHDKGNNDGDEGNWRNFDGSTYLDFDNWHTYPNDNAGSEGGHDCAYIERTDKDDGKRRWHETSCKDEYRFVCKVPENSGTRLHLLGEDEKVTRDDAVRLCTAKGMKLARAANYHKRMMIHSLNERYTVWVDGGDSKEEGVYLYSNGKSIELSESDEKYMGKHKDRQCLVVDNKGKLNDSKCSERREFVCEKW